MTRVGVSLTQACFRQGVYDDNQTFKCVSNLLAASYRHFILDLYWDPGLRQYRFCPVSNPMSNPSTRPVDTSEPTPTTSMASLSTVEIRTSQPASTSSATSSASGSSPLTRRNRQATRQASPVLQRSSSANSALRPVKVSPTTSVQTSLPSSEDASSHIGRYSCTRSLDFRKFAALIKDYLDATENTLQANILYLDINLHAAASSDGSRNSTGTLQASDLPTPSESLGAYLNSALSTYIYPASQLSKDRTNLNSSWYSGQRPQYPITDYFTSNANPDGTHSSPNGWPSEGYIQGSAHKRVLVGWSQIDEQMRGYDSFTDNNTLFPSGTFQTNRDYTISQNGTLSSGCYYQQDDTEIASTNSSWASASFLGPDMALSKISHIASNLTSCGISPILNQTLSSSPASQNLSLYHAIPIASIWNWAPSEPRNSSTNSTTANSDYRCAFLDVRSDYVGHWRVADCTTQYHAACRINGRPYEWTISESTIPFTSASGACPDGSTFAVPRTALENTYLYRQLLRLPRSRIDPEVGSPNADTSGVWLNFHSLTVEACWVTGGPDAGCPYSFDKDAQQQRTIIVPIVASIIALVITALTLFVKCNVNRRMSRRRKRGDGGWDYEGVPS